MLRIISFTEKGTHLAGKIESRIPACCYEKYTGAANAEEASPSEWTAEAFRNGDPILFIGAAGIAVRLVAESIKNKLSDVPVLVMDIEGNFVIPILSGHYGGANELAEQIAMIVGATPVITTATDTLGAFAPDLFAKKYHFVIRNIKALPRISGKSVAGEEITLTIDPDLSQVKEYFEREDGMNLPSGVVTIESKTEQDPSGMEESADICITCKPISDVELRGETLYLTPQIFHVGIGCKKDTSPEKLEEFFREQCASLTIDPVAIKEISSIDRKKEEPAILSLAEKLGVPFRTFSAEELNEVPGDFPNSAFVEETVGVGNVSARAAALSAGTGYRMILDTVKKDGMTMAFAGAFHAGEKKLYVVGIGPGKPEGMTIEAMQALSESEVIAGYPVYLKLLPEKFSGKKQIATGMTKEVERCRMALNEADQGKTVALVCSGDPGVYGMAGLVLSLREDYPEVKVRVIPGVTAALSGAALLGAPLIHDFSLISLSDRLTPWEKIEERLKKAAEGDFVIVLYNPESKGRAGYLSRACGILLNILPEDRASAYVRSIGREGEEVWTGTLNELSENTVDMFTTVFIGNSTTRKVGGSLVTERGYLYQ